MYGTIKSAIKVSNASCSNASCILPIPIHIYTYNNTHTYTHTYIHHHHHYYYYYYCCCCCCCSTVALAHTYFDDIRDEENKRLGVKMNELNGKCMYMCMVCLYVVGVSRITRKILQNSYH